MFLDYNDGKLLPVNKEFLAETTINNLGDNKVKFKFNPGMIPSKKYDFSFQPKEGIIKKVVNVFFFLFIFKSVLHKELQLDLMFEVLLK